jgi:hypothetical protein
MRRHDTTMRPAQNFIPETSLPAAFPQKTTDSGLSQRKATKKAVNRQFPTKKLLFRIQSMR